MGEILSASNPPWETKHYFRDDQGVIWPVDGRGKCPHPGEYVFSDDRGSIGIKPAGSTGWQWYPLWPSLNRMALAAEPEAFLGVAREVLGQNH